MCGICGWLNPNGVNMEALVTMNRLASHRGPDGEGYWLYSGERQGGKWIGTREVPASLNLKGTIGLGHRRLAIIDLSNAGLQPMASVDSRQWIVFNGEIYNYIELRRELSSLGHSFRTKTDTEVILAAFRQWGTGCFSRFNGMWALAIVDLEQRSLILSRDRLGIKPLYYLQSGNSFAFASEIKQFLGLPGFEPVANPDAIIEYIGTGYEIPPETFFQHVKAFPPACFGKISLEKISEPQARMFWKIEEIHPVRQTQPLISEHLKFLFEDAVKLRMRSDVPVGVCLSGGLDSSLIYGQIQSLTSKPHLTHAFSASYHEKKFDESAFVKLVISKHGGQVHYAYPDARSFLDDFDSFIFQHDEPPGGLSQYAAWAVMRLSRQVNVPVLLNGQGGDELFSGYWPAYYLYVKQQLLKNPPATIIHLLKALLPGGNPELLKEIPAHFRQYLIRRNQDNSKFLSPSLENKRGNNKKNWARQAQDLSPENYRWGEIRQIHLPRLLKWDDRNSMNFSIEGRYPFLDYRLVEFAMQLPVSINFHAGWNKYLLRTSLGHLLPDKIRWRRSKIGFVTPQSIWLQTALKEVLLNWVEKPSALFCQLVDYGKVKQLTRTLLMSGPIHPMNENQHLLFRLFYLDAWINKYKVIL